MITMITQAMYEQDFEKLTRKEQMEIRLKQLKEAVNDRDEELSQKNKELSQQKEEIQRFVNPCSLFFP